MNKLLSGLIGALAFCAVGSPGQAAPAIDAPVVIAVFHPAAQAEPVQTVQYYGQGRPGYGYGRPHFRGNPYRYGRHARAVHRRGSGGRGPGPYRRY